MWKYIFSFVVLVSVVLTSCNDQLDKINENPNATENPLSAYLLTGTLKQGADLYWGADNNFNSSLLFVQQWAKIQYTEPDRYDVSNTSFTSLWDTGYATLITNLNTILNFSSEETNDNYKGVALALRSWVFQLLTDAYGNIPYKEVGQTTTPSYDAQRDVYLGLLDDLKQAQSLLSTSGEVIEGDVVYNGDIAKWKKFVNSLRLRIALRMADREPELARTAVQEAASDAAGLIDGNTAIFQLAYLTSPQQNPAAAWFETRDDYRVSKTLINLLVGLNDPRLSIYAQSTEDESAGLYVGAANGLSNSDANNQGFAKTSKPGSYFLEEESPAVIFSTAEVKFALAEAVARGYLSGNAEALYKEGITASFNQFGITNEDVIADYLAQPLTAYDASDYKKSIGIQKWLAFYMQGLDAFAEWRRLDYPQLTAGPATVLDGEMPSRFFYPGTEQSLNGIHYQEAVKEQGNDLLTTKLWFDVK